MKFQLRRSIDAVPWADWTFVLAGLLAAIVAIYAIEQHGKSKKRRCPTCNQVVKESTK